MKKLNPIIFTIFMAISLGILCPAEGYAALSGNYTINSNLPASNTNYKNWASAIGDLTSGSRTDLGTAQGPGVSGAVTITVYDSVYQNTQVTLSAISGASSSNRITFKSAGGDSTACVLQFPSSSFSTDDYVLQLNGADYITFQEIGFERTGSNTYNTVIDITNDADYNKFLRCWMKGQKIPSSSSLGFQYGIGSIIFFTGSGDYNEIIQNKMIYGYNGIYSIQTATDNLIMNNVFDTSGSSGIYMTSQTNLRIIGNTFNMGDFGPSMGHYTSYGMRIESSPAMFISKNKVYMMAVNGQVVRAVIIANTTSSSSAPSMITNNFVWNSGGTGDCTGLAVYNVNYVNFYNNNILITNSLANGSVYYHYAAYTNTYINLVNNNLVNKGGGYVYNVPGTNTADIDTVDYNNSFATGSKYANWGGTDYTTFAAWKSASSKAANSVYGDPGFTSNTDLHVSNINLNGKAKYYTSVPDDIDGDSRNTSTPDIGADEFFPATNDAGVSNLDSPITFCPGNRNVKVTFQNYGIDTVKSVQIHWSVNGVGQSTYSWTGSVAPGNSSSSILLGNFSFSANTPYTFKVWTVNPNNAADQKNINDTITVTRSAGMAGSYSIGSSTSTDYKSFNDGITDMTSRGICGAVVFNVEDGTYNEQITLVQLPGMGPSNPVTFQSSSNDSSKVVVTLPSTTATGNNNAAIQLRGADFVTFKGITFQRTGINTYAAVVHILNGANNNTFTNCAMIGTNVTSANASGHNVWSDQSQDTGNVFRNNLIKFGTNSILFLGVASDHETGTVIEGNVFDSAYNSAVQIGFNDRLIVKGNTFKNVSVPASNNYDLELLDCDSAIRVIGNYFYDANSDIGIHQNLCDASSSNPGIIANNFIIKNSGIGIKLDGVKEQKIVFNSIYMKGTSSSNAGIATTSSTSSGITLSNNNIVMEGGYVFNINTGSQVSASNYNNLYAKGSQFVIWGLSYNGLVALISGTGKNAGSYAIDPFFNSSNDLHIKNPVLKGAAAPIAGVTLDIDGDVRNTTSPDIGADEFELTPNDAGIIAVIDPPNGVCEGQWPVSAVIKNFGGSPLTSATVTWRIGGLVQAPYNWTGNVATQGTDTFVVGNYNFVGNTNPTIIVKSTLPNGQMDGLNINDSIISGRLINAKPTVALGKDSTLCMGDSIVLGSPGSSGFAYQWFGLAGDSLADTAQLTVMPTTDSTLILVVTQTTSGCVNSDTVKLSVNSRPVADAGPDKIICPGASVQIGTSFQPGFGYSWVSQPPGFTSTGSGPIVSPTQTTAYILTKTITTTGCGATDTAVVTVSPLPTPQIQGNLNTCEGGTEVYSTASNTGSAYSWKITGGQIVSGQNSNSITVSWTGTGSGTLTVKETNAANCVDSVTQNITLNPTPEAKMVISGSCANRAISFEDISANVQSRLWRFGDGNTATGAAESHTYSATGSYVARLIVTNSFGCTDSVEQTLNLVDAPTADFTTGTPVCEGESITFTNSSVNANSYLWTFGSGQTSVQPNPAFTFNTAGDYDVKLMAYGMGCNDSITQEIIVNALPDASFTIDPPVGQQVKFRANNTSGASYLWDFGDGRTSQLMSPVHAYTDMTGWKVVTLTVTSQEGCTSSFIDSVFVTVIGIEERLPASLLSLAITPNPFQHETLIAFDLAKVTDLEVSLFDIQGLRITTLINGNYSGKVLVDVDSEGLQLKSGIYLLRISTGQSHVTRKLIKME